MRALKGNLHNGLLRSWLINLIERRTIRKVRLRRFLPATERLIDIDQRNFRELLLVFLQHFFKTRTIVMFGDRVLTFTVFCFRFDLLERVCKSSSFKKISELQRETLTPDPHILDHWRAVQKDPFRFQLAFADI